MFMVVRIISFLFIFLGVSSLSGCGNDRTGALDGVNRSLVSMGSWSSRSTWEFASVGDSVIMRGVGRYWDRGLGFYWEERWGGSMVFTKLDRGMISTEVDGERDVHDPRSVDRIKRSLHYAMDPVLLVRRWGIELHGGDGYWVGSGRCDGTECVVGLNFHSEAGIPKHIEMIVVMGENWFKVSSDYFDIGKSG